jgi:hypothetical protein
MKGTALVLACCAMVVFCSGCSEEDGGNGENGDGLAGVFLTGTNAEQMAGLAASGIDLFPGLTEVLHLLIERIDAMPAPGPLAAVIDLGDIGLCSGGEATATWNDVDGNSMLSAGDKVDLEVVGCDGVDGTLSATYLSVGLEGGAADLELDLAFREEGGASVQVETVRGKFRVEVEDSGPPGTLVFRYLVPEKTDGTRGLTSTRNGVLAYEMGCFNFYFTVNLSDGSFTLSEPIAVFKVPGQGIMSLVAWGLPPLVFESEDIPVSGKLAFYGEADVLPCASIGVPGGGVDSNDSFFILTASGEGNLTLTGKTGTGEPFSVETNWDDIR